MSINEYFKNMKEYVEILLSRGYNISDDERLSHILDA